MSKIRFCNTEIDKNISGYENLDYSNPIMNINGSVEEIVVDDVSFYSIQTVKQWLEYLYSKLTINNGTLNIAGSNLRSHLRLFNGYNLDVEELNNVLYNGRNGCYTIEYIADLMVEVGFKIERKFFTDKNKFCVIGVKNGK